MKRAAGVNAVDRTLAGKQADSHSCRRRRATERLFFERERERARASS